MHNGPVDKILEALGVRKPAKHPKKRGDARGSAAKLKLFDARPKTTLPTPPKKGRKKPNVGPY